VRDRQLGKEGWVDHSTKSERANWASLARGDYWEVFYFANFWRLPMLMATLLAVHLAGRGSKLRVLSNPSKEPPLPLGYSYYPNASLCCRRSIYVECVVVGKLAWWTTCFPPICVCGRAGGAPRACNLLHPTG
jgi:hypothetical protein